LTKVECECIDCIYNRMNSISMDRRPECHLATIKIGKDGKCAYYTPKIGDG